MADDTAAGALGRAREALRAAGRLRPFTGREVLMRTGDRSDEVLLVEAGVVKIVLPAGNGSDVVTGLHGPGALIGELAVLHSQPRSATVVCHRRGLATHVRGSVFRDLVYRNRDVHVLVDVTQRQRLRNADRRQLAVASMDVMSRVIAQLCDWATNFGERVDGGLALRGLSHRDLAGAVLASEKHVDAVLRDLRSAGLVRTGRLCFVVADPNRLAARSVEIGHLPVFRE